MDIAIYQFPLRSVLIKGYYWDPFLMQRHLLANVLVSRTQSDLSLINTGAFLCHNILVLPSGSTQSNLAKLKG